MNLDLLLKVLTGVNIVLPLAGALIQAITHIVGSDKHHTIAGDIAEKMVEAGQLAGALRKDLLNGVQHGDPQADPPT